MMRVKKSALCAVATVVLCGSALAQSSVPDAVTNAAEMVKVAAEEAAPVAITQELVLTSGAPITLAVSEEANSSTHKEGDAIKLTVLNDISVGSTVVIPRGTPATGEVTWRTGKGAFGKSGKLEFDLRSVDLNGKRIPVTGSYRQEGEGNTIATGVGVLAVGVFAAFITGKRARLPVGRELMAQTAQAVVFGADGKISQSFDSEKAMADAESKTKIGECRIAARALATEKKREKALEECFVARMD